MWQIFVILGCLVLNALIAATEFAFIAVRLPRLKKMAAEGNRSAERVLALRERPERTLSILQLGITFIGTIAAAFGGAEIGTRLTHWLHVDHGMTMALSQIFAILLFVVPYTYINVVFSELLPKSLALRNPKWVIFRFERSLVMFDTILSPIVTLLEKSTTLSVRLFFSWVKREELPGEELMAVSSLLRPYMLNLANIEKQTLFDIMVPWEDVDTVSADETLEQVKKQILQTGHTRLPVVGREKVLGTLFTKRFMAFIETGNPDWQTLVQPIIEMEGTYSLIAGLRKMQTSRSHLSLITLEGKPVGIVTIEDILEEVVGEIYDEDDIRTG